MKNAPERQKLLKQLADSEKTAANYFDVQKEFFLITAENLSEVQTRLYGYSIQANGIYEDDNLTAQAAAGLDGRGCYVYVEVRDNKITIRQDLNGCWGVYFFRRGNYFALSNSFFRLLDHVKFICPLTPNRNYLNYLLVIDLCNEATYSDTAVNEIQLLDRNAIVTIDLAAKNFQIELPDCNEHTVALNSAEGMATLDRWFDFWCGVLRGIASHTKFLAADLSGGFDSRISLPILLHSGINIDEVKINSTNNKLHTHAEDYAIASAIANHYGFKLNKPFPPRNLLKYSLTDIFNIIFYSHQTVHKHPYVPLQKSAEKCYTLNGFAGENVRANWHDSTANFVTKKINDPLKKYSPDLGLEVAISIKNILEAALVNICHKHGIKNLDSTYTTQYLYQETRCRHHFGKISLVRYFGNNLSLSPALDPELRTLQFDTPELPDPKLLMALIFIRYEPQLLNFPFQGNRTINPQTVAFAQKLNEAFPRRATTNQVERGGVFNLRPLDTKTAQAVESSRNNENISKETVEAFTKAAFESARTYGLFRMYFDEELYRYAAEYYEKQTLGRIRYINGVVGVTKVLEDVEISNRNRPLYRDMKRFLEKDFSPVNI